MTDLARLRAAASALEPERVTLALAKTFAEWARPGSARCEQWIATQRVFSPEMLRRALDLGLSDWTEAALRDWVERERPAQSIGPRLTAVWVAGAIPTNAFALVAAPLLAGSAVYAHPASVDPHALALFVDTLAAHDPAVAAAVALGRDERALRESDAVIVEGRDATLATLRGQVPPDRCFVGYGHKLSLATVGADAPLGAAVDLALDLALYDGRGCLSPACVAVEDRPVGRAVAFAEALAAELERLERELPRGPLDAAEHLGVRELRAGWSSVEGARSFAPERGTDWGVTCLPEDSHPAPGALRNVPVVAVRDVSGLETLCASYAPHLSTLGHAGWRVVPERLTAIALRAGGSRVCPLGRMQLPPLAWRHDGRGAIAVLMRSADVER